MKRLTRIALILLAASTLFGSNHFTSTAASKEKIKSMRRVTDVKQTRGGKSATASSPKRKSSGTSIQTIHRDTTTGEWIHRGKAHIVIHRDSLGVVRAMSPFRGNSSTGLAYSQAVNAYADSLAADGVRVYSLLAPSQGEYYMPEMLSDECKEREVIRNMYGFLNPTVTPIHAEDSLALHVDEQIYNNTDHHWAPLGAYYAASALAEAAGVDFLPLSAYTPDTIRNYVGTMFKFSGDPAIKSAPELFVFYRPQEGYSAEFIDYTVKNQQTVAETAPHVANFFRKFPDGSGAAYSTFMGGDSHTVKVSGTGGTPGRRLLIVKDSFGNAMASNLFGSFEEVHVADFRYFPHNLLDYVRDNGITDLAFVNSVHLAAAQNAPRRLNLMLHGQRPKLASEQPEETESDEEADEIIDE